MDEVIFMTDTPDAPLDFKFVRRTIFPFLCGDVVLNAASFLNLFDEFVTHHIHRHPLNWDGVVFDFEFYPSIASPFFYALPGHGVVFSPQPFPSLLILCDKLTINIFSHHVISLNRSASQRLLPSQAERTQCV